MPEQNNRVSGWRTLTWSIFPELRIAATSTAFFRTLPTFFYIDENKVVDCVTMRRYKWGRERGGVGEHFLEKNVWCCLADADKNRIERIKSSEREPTVWKIMDWRDNEENRDVEKREKGEGRRGRRRRRRIKKKWNGNRRVEGQVTSGVRYRSVRVRVGIAGGGTFINPKA